VLLAGIEVDVVTMWLRTDDQTPRLWPRKSLSDSCRKVSRSIPVFANRPAPSARARSKTESPMATPHRTPAASANTPYGRF
jgi:hypothetical protein